MMLPLNLKLVGSADETYGSVSLDVKAGLGTLRELNVIVGVRGTRNQHRMMALWRHGVRRQPRRFSKMGRREADARDAEEDEERHEPLPVAPHEARHAVAHAPDLSREVLPAPPLLLRRVLVLLARRLARGPVGAREDGRLDGFAAKLGRRGKGVLAAVVCVVARVVRRGGGVTV